MKCKICNKEMELIETYFNNKTGNLAGKFICNNPNCKKLKGGENVNRSKKF